MFTLIHPKIAELNESILADSVRIVSPIRGRLSRLWQVPPNSGRGGAPPNAQNTTPVFRYFQDAPGTLGWYRARTLAY